MLTREDIEMIKQTRKELTAHRMHDVVLVYYVEESEFDPITGEPIGESSAAPIATKAVVTEMSSETRLERILLGGISVQRGDINVAVDLDIVADVYDNLINVAYDGKIYEILATDKKGIGERNRAEIFGRLIT